MKYDVMKKCLIRAVEYNVGDVVELDLEIATHLMAIGRIAPHALESKKEDRSIGLSEDSPKPKRRAKK